jgi:hypothetical protein
LEDFKNCSIFLENHIFGKYAYLKMFTFKKIEKILKKIQVRKMFKPKKNSNFKVFKLESYSNPKSIQIQKLCKFENG